MRDHAQIIEFLRKGRWFAGLPPRLQSLLVERAHVRSYRKGEYLIREGTPSKGILAILEGRVRGSRSVSDGDEVTFYIGDPGFWVGEFATLARTPCIGSYVAETTVRALLLPAAEFERIVEQEPRYFRMINELNLERYALLFRYMAEAGALGREEWLHTRLADLAAMRRAESPASDPDAITMSQADIAKMVGVSRQTLSRLLDRLARRGLIEIGYRSIRVIAPVAAKPRAIDAARGGRPVAAAALPPDPSARARSG